MLSNTNSNMLNVDDKQQTMGDGDQILICYKHEGRPKKDTSSIQLYKPAKF